MKTIFPMAVRLALILPALAALAEEKISDPTITPKIEHEIRKIAESLRTDLANAKAYKPTTSQINFLSRTLNDAEVLRAYAEAVYAEMPAGQPAAKPGQTEILITGPELTELPGGYTTRLGHFRKGIEIYGFKFVEPGKTTGMAYDGLFKRDGQWFFLPKAWRAFERSTQP